MNEFGVRRGEMLERLLPLSKAENMQNFKLNLTKWCKVQCKIDVIHEKTGQMGLKIKEILK